MHRTQMQSWVRAVVALRAACSTSSRTATRALSEAARPVLDGGAAEAEGAKTTLHRLLAGAEKPLTTAEVWVLAESEGLKSKRFVKQMLLQMRRSGHVRAMPLAAAAGKKQKAQFAFVLPAAEPDSSEAAPAPE